jgi:hypothetical protein
MYIFYLCKHLSYLHEKILIQNVYTVADRKNFTGILHVYRTITLPDKNLFLSNASLLFASIKKSSGLNRTHAFYLKVNNNKTTLK